MYSYILGVMQYEIQTPLEQSFTKIPFLDMSVAAGFPNPCENFIHRPISLDTLMIKRASSTFLVRVNGDSMIPTIPDGAILVVDKSVKATNGRIVVAVIDGEFIVKELCESAEGNPILHSHNINNPDIPIRETDLDWSTTVIWGVVTGFLKQF